MPKLTLDSLTDHTDTMYRLCAEQGLRYATSVLRNRNDAEEAVQEAFFRIHASGRPQDDKVYRGKFFVALRNHCIDLIRRRKVRKEVVIGSPITDQDMNQNQVGFQEDLASIEQAIRELPDKWQQALNLRIHGELSYEEIATVTGSTLPQVRTWIYRARRQLVEQLKSKGVFGNQS